MVHRKLYKGCLSALIVRIVIIPIFPLLHSTPLHSTSFYFYFFLEEMCVCVCFVTVHNRPIHVSVSTIFPSRSPPLSLMVYWVFLVSYIFSSSVLFCFVFKQLKTRLPPSSEYSLCAFSFALPRSRSLFSSCETFFFAFFRWWLHGLGL